MSRKTSRKVFKISELHFLAGETIRFEKSQRFTDFTTRKHFARAHRIEILVNGNALVGAFGCFQKLGTKSYGLEKIGQVAAIIFQNKKEALAKSRRLHVTR